jgi:von Willebrand factor type A domain/Aerotolerance regulator N-terminal
MFLLNLSVVEFLGIFGAISSFVVVLYLLDRSRRRQVVATLKFWMPSEMPSQKKHRRRIQQPWSLLLQLFSLLLLVLAIAQLRFGSRDSASRDHVLLLDTSAWMGARAGDRTLMDQARADAIAYVRSLPGDDRVMIVRADALATPATAFESNRQSAENAIRQSKPGYAALNLDQAFNFAREAIKLQGRRAGEIVYAGAGRIPEHDRNTVNAPSPGLRLLLANTPVENCGLRKIGLRRSVVDPEVWEIFISVRNYGARARTLPVALTFGGAPIGRKTVTLPPGQEAQVVFEHRTRAAGWIEARLLTKDAFPDDDRAVLELPEDKALRVVVYSAEPATVKPMLAATRRVEAVFRSPAEYQPNSKASIVILDRFKPPAPPVEGTVWIEPPPGASPFTVVGERQDVALTRWRSDHSLGAGLRTKDWRLESAQLFKTTAADIPVAEVDGGAVIVARAGTPKQVVLGFHPGRSAMRYELATPLLFANILRWMAPEIFRRWELTAGSVGTVSVPVEPDTNPGTVRVVTDQQRPLPFTVQGNAVRFFSGAPGMVRVSVGDREMAYSLTLPDMAEAIWDPPKSARRGVPRGWTGAVGSVDLWRWLAILGGLGLAAEWMLFGRRGNQRLVTRVIQRARPLMRRAS